MKLLLTADLHFRVHWFRWLIEQARDFDLVCIAGDLLDMFKFESRTAQAREVRNYLRELADIVPVAVCSGNHDNAGRQISPDRAPVYEWIVELSSHPNIITDGSTQKVGNLIVTTVPYHCSKEQKSVWLDRGFTVRRQTGNTWLVLHHVPPMTGSDASGEEREAAELLVNYHPDYFVSGHAHALFDAAQRLGVCLDHRSIKKRTNGGIFRVTLTLGLGGPRNIQTTSSVKNFCVPLHYLKITGRRCGLCSPIRDGGQGSFHVSPKDSLISRLTLEPT